MSSQSFDCVRGQRVPGRSSYLLVHRPSRVRFLVFEEKFSESFKRNKENTGTDLVSDVGLLTVDLDFLVERTSLVYRFTTSSLEVLFWSQDNGSFFPFFTVLPLAEYR